MAKIKTKIGVYKFRQKNLYLGLKQINKIIAKKNLLDAKRVLDDNGLYFGLIFGTLLGAVREHDFIAHDEDIDLFILKEDEENFKVILFMLQDIGFKLIRYDRRGLYSIERNGEYIDFYIFSEFSKGVYHSGSDYILERHLRDTADYEFQGDLFRIPENYEEFCNVHYGRDWRTPIVWTTYKLSKIAILKNKTEIIIKRLLPNKIFYYLQFKKSKAKRLKFFNRLKMEELNNDIEIRL